MSDAMVVWDRMAGIPSEEAWAVVILASAGMCVQARQAEGRRQLARTQKPTGVPIPPLALARLGKQVASLQLAHVLVALHLGGDCMQAGRCK